MAARYEIDQLDSGYYQVLLRGDGGEVLAVLGSFWTGEEVRARIEEFKSQAMRAELEQTLLNMR